jgi:hypothetical protein
MLHTTRLEQMMERLLAVIKAMEKNLDLHLEKIIAKLDAH